MWNMRNSVARISGKGQVVIPAELRGELNLVPGTEVSIQRQGNAIVLRPITPEFIDGLVGSTTGAGNAREQAHAVDEER